MRSQLITQLCSTDDHALPWHIEIIPIFETHWGSFRIRRRWDWACCHPAQWPEGERPHPGCPQCPQLYEAGISQPMADRNPSPRKSRPQSFPYCQRHSLHILFLTCPPQQASNPSTSTSPPFHAPRMHQTHSPNITYKRKTSNLVSNKLHHPGIQTVSSRHLNYPRTHRPIQKHK